MGVHCLVLVALLRPPTPTLLKVQQLRMGEGGRSFTRLSWSRNSHELAGVNSKPRSRADREQTLRSKRLQAPSRSRQIRLRKLEPTIAANQAEKMTSAGLSHVAASAGSRNGSLAEGDLTGSEVRPALWIAGPNPAISASEFAEGLEGSVIVEITIDDQGNVVATQLLQGLSPAVDSRVLEALQIAHFIPAKRNGVAIASKQDVYYHFPR